MKSGPFSRQEMVAIAAKEFPSVPHRQRLLRSTGKDSQ
jgi:hypothetical protein